MFANCQLFGVDLAFPDVCLTPMPAPTPIPYPDIALGPTAIPNALNILFMGMPAHNMATVTPLTVASSDRCIYRVVKRHAGDASNQR